MKFVCVMHISRWPLDWIPKRTWPSSKDRTTTVCCWHLFFANAGDQCGSGTGSCSAGAQTVVSEVVTVVILLKQIFELSAIELTCHAFDCVTGACAASNECHMCKTQVASSLLIEDDLCRHFFHLRFFQCRFGFCEPRFYFSKCLADTNGWWSKSPLRAMRINAYCVLFGSCIVSLSSCCSLSYRIRASRWHNTCAGGLETAV